MTCIPLKKGGLSITEYITKVKNMCALLKVSGSRIPEAEKVEIVLAALPPEFDSIITLAAFSSEPLPLQRLVDVLLEYESRSMLVVLDVPLCANLLEAAPSQTTSIRGGRFSSGGRGRGFRTCL